MGALIDELNNRLTQDEIGQLKHYEGIVDHNLRGFKEAGEALAEIRDRELFRQHYPSFAAYLEQRWGISRKHGYRLIDAAAIAVNVSHGTQLPEPTTERAARALSVVPREEQPAVWAEAVERSGGSPAPARVVDQVVADRAQLGEADMNEEDNRAAMVLQMAGPNRKKPEASAADRARDVFTSSTGSATNEWYTPKEIIEAAREVLGEIDLDPASCQFANRVVRALTYYTEEDNGLDQRWVGRLFVNCPYGKGENNESNQARWTAKLIESFDAGDVTAAIALVNAATGNAWFQKLWRFPICLPRRFAFYNESGTTTPTNHSAIVYLGSDPARFYDVFSKIGVVVRATTEEDWHGTN